MTMNAEDKKYAEEKKQTDRLKLLEQIADSATRLVGYSKLGYLPGSHPVSSSSSHFDDSEDFWEDIFQLLHRLDLVDQRDTHEHEHEHEHEREHDQADAETQS